MNTIPTSVLDYLLQKIEKEPTFANYLSETENEAIEKYKVDRERKRNEQLNFVEKRDRYRHFDSSSLFFRSYWTEGHEEKDKKLLEDCWNRTFRVVNFDDNQFKGMLSNWLTDETAPNPFAGNEDEWMTEQQMFDYMLHYTVGDLADTVKGKDRFYICMHPPYSYERTFGGTEHVAERLSTIDILRGTGVYGIMTYSQGDDISYFNEHYFKNISELTDKDVIYNAIKSEFNFFTKRKDEKFALCECDFDKGGVHITNTSPFMTYEEHFIRLFGKLPSRFANM